VMGAWAWSACPPCGHAESRHLPSGCECVAALFSKTGTGVLATEWNCRHGLRGNRIAGRELSGNQRDLHALLVRRRPSPSPPGRIHCGNVRASSPPPSKYTLFSSILTYQQKRDSKRAERIMWDLGISPGSFRRPHKSDKPGVFNREVVGPFSKGLKKRCSRTRMPFFWNIRENC